MRKRSATFAAGQRFELKADIAAVEISEDRTCPLVIPSGSIVRVTRHPCLEDIRLVEAEWEDHLLRVCDWDLQYRADEMLATIPGHPGWRKEPANSRA